MKSILLSIKPKYVSMILNKDKTIEIRRRFPKDYVGWVYIYCTKNSFLFQTRNGKWVSKGDHFYESCNPIHYEGKVVARFWCDKVETFRCNVTGNLKDGFFKAKPYCRVIEDGIANYNCDAEFENILKNAQLTNKELAQYLGDKECPYGGWYVFNAIHITNLEIFDKPKEISEFMKVSCKGCPFENTQTCHNDITGRYCRLTRAPQSWCWMEV